MEMVYILYSSLSFFVLIELSANRALGPRALTTKTKPKVIEGFAQVHSRVYHLMFFFVSL